MQGSITWSLHTGMGRSISMTPPCGKRGLVLGTNALLDDSDAFYDSQTFFREDPNHPAYFAPVIPGENFDLIAGFDVELRDYFGDVYAGR
jgi:hypothetical protein